MSDQRPDDRVARLADLALTYREVGATGTELPEGYAHAARNEVVGHGREAFRAAGESLMTWDVHRRAGLTVEASSPRVAVGVNVLLTPGPAWSPIKAPCRVVHVVEQPDRIGFTYGTLPGHPVSGEESFSVLIDDDATVRFVLIAFSRPATLLQKLTGRIAGLVQDRILDRYTAALREAAAKP